MASNSQSQTPEEPPVRFRVVLELDFPDADPWDPSDYGQFLKKIQEAVATRTGRQV